MTATARPAGVSTETLAPAHTRRRALPGSVVPYLYILPAVVVMIVGLAWPIVDAIRLAFYDWALGTDWSTARWTGGQAFEAMLRSRQVWTSMGVTVAFVLIAVSLEMVLGIALALALERPVRGMRFFRTLFVLPMMIAPICVGLIWRYLFDANFGPINHWIGLLGIGPRAWLAEPGLAFAAMVVTDVWQWTPFVFIMVLAALQGVDASILEAARIDGATAWQQISRIKLPVIKPILVVTLLMRMIDGFRGLEVIYVMTFGGPGQATELFSLHIYKAAFISQQLGYSAALSLLLLAIVTALALGVLLFSNPLKPVAPR